MVDPRDARADAKADKARAKALRPWYKKKRFMIPLVLVVLFGIGSLAGGGVDSPSGDDADSSARGGVNQDSDRDNTAGLNQPVRDGKFEFTVKGIECGQTSVGSQFLKKEAQGQYCVLSLNIKNIGTEAQTMFGDNQKLIDSQGREFSSDSAAAIYSDQSKVWLEQINPGNAVDGQMYFDVPKDAQPVKVKLHDSAFSGGVVVNLA
ncbi:MAG: DUF4352 domain-containing protein [Actinomycetota bacterium]